jgi:hypothetical protein
MRPILAASLAALAVAAAGAAGAQPPAPGQREFSLTLYEQPDYRGASVTFYGDNANIGSTGFADRARSAQVRGTWRLCEGGGYRNRCEVLSANVRDLDAYGLSGRVGSAQLLGAADRAYADDRRAPYGQPYPPAPYRDDDRGAARPPAGYYPDQPYPEDDRGAPAYPPALDAPRGSYGAPSSPLPPPPDRGADRYRAEEPDGIEGATSVFFPRPTLRGWPVSAWRRGAADAFCRAQGLGPAIYFDQGGRAREALEPDGRRVGDGPVLRDVLCRR